MSDPKPPTPRLHHRPITVDYIDNHLQKYHPAFVNPPIRFDSMSGHYVLKDQALVQRPAENLVVASGASDDLLDDYGVPPRPELTSTNSMKYWNAIFPEAMKQLRLTTKPKGRAGAAFDIRNKQDWDSVYGALEEARNKYKSEGGSLGWVRKVRRKGADNINMVGQTVKIVSKAVPSNPYSTPILGAVEILLDVIKNAADVRDRALNSFDGLIPIFSDVELFLGTFKGDVHIEKQSMDLIFTVLVSIERAISFFTSNECDQYESDLIDSLDSIEKKSKSLMWEAAKSHIHKFDLYSRETRKLQEDTLQAVNSFDDLLREYIQQNNRKHEAAMQESNRKHEAVMQATANLRVEMGMLRAASPSQLIIMPAPHIPASVIQWYISQDVLRQILDIPDVDLTDIVFVGSMKNQLPPRQRVLTEQIIRTKPFRKWIVSPSSTKLLVQWDFRLPKTIAGISPLSVFCTNVIQTLRSKENFVSAVWICGQHNDDRRQASARIGGRAMLASLIDQLLRQHTFDLRALHHEIDPNGLQGGRIEALMDLLSWLVRQLPPTTTFICIVDGVVLFEHEDFKSEALPVFQRLLALTNGPSLCANVKVLFTSTPGTQIVRGAFEEEDLLLNVHTLPQLVCPPNGERVDRELGREL
ncbi:hypothetical protein CcaCcLH18_11179 [Colletotrichum camelliae]|nr:hypothetical protein CcaCcLH18_11179 [Colletotrichum camelliae]